MTIHKPAMADTGRLGETSADVNTANSPGRHKSDERRRAILRIAEELFLNEGYDKSSMSAIAARLGGSKGTLYNYFASKEALLEAIILDRCESYRHEFVTLLSEDPDPRDVLMSYGRRFLTKLSGEAHVRFQRLIMGEAERRPEFGTFFYQVTIRNGALILADYMAELVQRGVLELDDPEMAAHHFVALCQNRFLKVRLFNAAPPPDAREIEAEISAAVKAFFRAYGKH